MSASWWKEANGTRDWTTTVHIGQRLQQRRAALALNAGRVAAKITHQPEPQRPTMNETIQRLTRHLADLKAQRASIASTTVANIAQAERAAAGAYQAMLDAIADGRDPTAEAQAHQAAQAALQTARLQADVGEVRAQRLAAEIEDTADQLANAEGARRRALIAELEGARDELERELMEMTERRFEAEVRGLHINARLHQLNGSPGAFFGTIPAPYAYPTLRPRTMSDPAPSPVYPELQRKDVMLRIGAEVAQIGADL